MVGKNARERTKNKMKIAQVCPRYHPVIGGVETHVREIGERLAERGFEVEVACIPIRLEDCPNTRG